MEQEKILRWITTTEKYFIRGYEIDDGVQVLHLYRKNEELEVHYLADVPNFYPLLRKTPFWKFFFTAKKYETDYEKTVLTCPPYAKIKETIGGVSFVQYDELLAKILPPFDKKLRRFHDVAQTEWLPSRSKNMEMYPLLDYFYDDLLLEYAEKYNALSYIRALFAQCSLERENDEVVVGKLPNPLQYFEDNRNKGFPFEAMVLAYFNELSALIRSEFFRDVKALGNLLDCSENEVLQLSDGTENCLPYLHLPKMMNKIVDYLDY